MEDALYETVTAIPKVVAIQTNVEIIRLSGNEASLITEQKTWLSDSTGLENQRRIESHRTAPDEQIAVKRQLFSDDGFLFTEEPKTIRPDINHNEPRRNHAGKETASAKLRLLVFSGGVAEAEEGRLLTAAWPYHWDMPIS